MVTKKSSNKAQAATPEPATEKDVRVRVFKGHENWVWRVAMPADGRFALTTSEDGTVRKWDLVSEQGAEVDTGVVLAKSEDGTAFWGVAVSADGLLAAAGDRLGRMLLLDPQSAATAPPKLGDTDSCPDSNAIITIVQAHSRKTDVGSLAFSGDGERQRQTQGQDRLELHSIGTDEFLRRWDVRKLQRWQGNDTSAASDDTCIASCQLPFNWSESYGLAADADGSRIVGACRNEGLVVWSGKGRASLIIAKENVSDACQISVTANGRFAFAGTEDGVVAQWDLESGNRVAAFEGHSRDVYAVAVTPDGRFCVSGSGDRTVRLWGVETGQCLAILRGHTNDVLGVAITPDARRIASVDWQGNTLRVWDIPQAILDRAATSRKRGYKNAKVVLLGDSGVGKSGLALRLWHDRWKKTESTHGMEIQRLSDLPKSDLEDSEVEHEVWLWDLAGQPDYRLTHQLFMEQTSLALLVFDPQDKDLFDTVSYWQSALSKVATAEIVQGVLVAARCDRKGLRLTLGEVEQWARKRGMHGPLITKAKLKTKNGVKELRELIAKLLPWENIEWRSTPETFPPLKDAILSLRDDATDDGGVIVTPEQLLARVKKTSPKLKFTEDDLLAVTNLLGTEGVLYQLPYGRLVVLQPSWINSYASTLVKLAAEADNQLGYIPMSMIAPGKLPNDDGTDRLSHEDEEQLLPALVELFLRRALAWKQETNEGTMLVFPYYALLPREEAPPRPGKTVTFRFTGPLEEIYCTLVVRLYYSGLFTSEPRLYRRGVDFKTHEGRLAALTLVEEGDRGELELYFDAKMSQDVQATIHKFAWEHLERKADGLQRLRDYFCPKCKREAPREQVDHAIENGWPKLRCGFCPPDKEPGMMNLKDALERQMSARAVQSVNEAKRNASERISNASMEQQMVGEVMSLVASVGQIYRIVSEPDEGVDGEIEFRNDNAKATGVAYRVQLKSGDSHLKVLKSGIEKFPMKKHYEEYWTAKGMPETLLIIRSSDGRTRFINATKAIRSAKRKSKGKRVTQLVFDSQDFTKEAVLRLRDERLKDA
tara:strand:+ start:305906 stop:309055 length:3150 start_codon:yes stop_codon:yes gene_type:complete